MTSPDSRHEESASKSLARTSHQLFILASLALLALVSYLPALSQPFIEDDYPNIELARVYGPVSGWTQMAGDGVQRVRATTFILSHWIERIFGLRPWAFYAAGLLLHICNCWLLYALGGWPIIGRRVSFWSAAFFAVYEGHQEAIMWYSACNELLLFLFGMLSLLCWLNFLDQKRARWRWRFASLCFFTLALLSKESAVIFVPLLSLPLLLPERKMRLMVHLIPFALLAALSILSVFLTRSYSFRFHDGSFVLSAPFWLTWSKSFFALFWFWGLLSIIALLAWRASQGLLRVALIWIGISLTPYMFVAYVHRIPSRQIYLASAGLSLIVGAAIVALRARYGPARRWIPAAILIIILIHNIYFLWTRKRQQFLERARPTEQLIAAARNINGPLYVRCFPRPPIIGDSAVKLALGKPLGTLIWDEQEARRRTPAATFCYQPK
ncbi:MAG: hypothetical protein QOD00_1906 [Blastocatellia bacterium]|nr:hypothetical protein [Blastocatellia bacterium]